MKKETNVGVGGGCWDNSADHLQLCTAKKGSVLLSIGQTLVTRRCLGWELEPKVSCFTFVTPWFRASSCCSGSKLLFPHAVPSRASSSRGVERRAICLTLPTQLSVVFRPQGKRFFLSPPLQTYDSHLSFIVSHTFPGIPSPLPTPSSYHTISLLLPCFASHSLFE
jgi:hypothetical protein